MAVSARLACQAARQALLHCRSVISVQPIRTRYKRIHRGKWPEEARTFQQRLDELNQRDAELDRMVNIGFPLQDRARKGSSEDRRHQQWSKTRNKLEYAARHRESTVHAISLFGVHKMRPQ
ncbi:hypothetical protein BaRGS_00008513 [Batillaria attramentaria]|uniref:Uncharacterized protein n=1 Tax=Batillaria attramentaria TaxID=370345 RepID=A0ABD0LLC2_9CAEN